MKGTRWWLVLAAATCGAGDSRIEAPFIRQEKNGCGAASVAMVAHYWARHGAQAVAAPPASEIYDRLRDPAGEGIRLAEMKRYFEELGFRAFTLRGEWSDLGAHLEKGRPVIVALKGGRGAGLHFAVVSGIEGGRVWLNDPTRKRPVRWKGAEFRKRWEGAGRWMLLAVPRGPEEQSSRRDAARE